MNLSHPPASLPSPAQRLAARERPGQRAAGYQRWNHLLFAHWQVDPAALQATLPRGLFVDRHEGRAYVGIVPFFMQRVRPAWLPPLPWLSWFLELNVRTYVHDASGRPGVWFYSLDCDQPLAVALARRFFHLPYEHARMSACRSSDGINYLCQRRSPGAPALRYTWRPQEGGATAEPRTLEFFLVERYLLFSADARGRLYRGRVHHAPYRIHSPEVTACPADPAHQAGFAVEGNPCSLLAAEAVDVTVFPLQRTG